ncbi:MAG: metallophosphoesterase [Bacilli bacterium]|jgi:predicted MPP superfamily phosphohydrolase|nr:metallophosphoesterase [Bacilli bacterium]
MNKKMLVSLISLVIIVLLIFLIFFTFPTNYKNKIKVASYEHNAFNTKIINAKVIVFSDTHLYYDYNIPQLKMVVDKINEQSPDIVIFNGDLINNKAYALNKEHSKINKQIITELKRINPLYGKFAILGEQDETNKDTPNILNEADFEILNNTIRPININNKHFNIIGLKDNKDPLKILSKANDKDFNMVIAHNPNIIDKITNNKIDLIVCGHTLGGQYYLPLIGSIFKDIKTYKYYRGTNNINGIKTYTSNGLGIYQSNMRFNTPSTIETFILY